MRTLIVILTLAAFLQTTIIPINLVLMVVVLRSFLVLEKENLLLAFAFGLLLDHLNASSLGMSSMVLLLSSVFARAISRLPSSNILVVIPLIIITSLLDGVVTSLVNHSSLSLLPAVLTPAILAIPVYIVLRFWEERFIVSPQLKLKI